MLWMTPIATPASQNRLRAKLNIASASSIHLRIPISFPVKGQEVLVPAKARIMNSASIAMDYATDEANQ